MSGAELAFVGLPAAATPASATPIAAVPVPAAKGLAGTVGRPATEPPEAHGLDRDEVRLLIAGDGAIRHARFRELPRFLRRGDLLVVNGSATLPAAIDGSRGDGSDVVVHFSTALDDGSWVVEVRPPGRATGPVGDARQGELVVLAGGAELRLLASYPAAVAAPTRLWRASVSVADGVVPMLDRHGRPIAYAYVEGRWPLAAYQTVFARHPGSAEMPSAGRPFTRRLVAQLLAAGIEIAPVLLHTGVSSLEAGEPPLPERFEVGVATAKRIEAAHRARRRVIAVGTTAARAVETVAETDGTLRAAAGWTDLQLGPERPARVVDAILTGWHEPGTSHLRLLEAVAPPDTVRRAYREAVASAYLWHEFGDSCLLFGGT